MKRKSDNFSNENREEEEIENEREMITSTKNQEYELLMV